MLAPPHVSDSRLRSLCLILGFLSALFLLVGESTFQGKSPSKKRERLQNRTLFSTDLLSAQLKPFPHPPEEERWRDLAGAPYTDSFRSKFTYADAKVTIQYFQDGPSFCGRITARGLKPYFAYQIKLRGDYSASQTSHRKIGFTGRWRLPGSGLNYTDHDVLAYEKPEDVESYLLFDYFMTDINGDACHDFRLEHSLHVLWNDTVNSYPPPREALVRHIILSGRTSPIYGTYIRPAPVTIWAENEGVYRKRFRVGKAQLPPGTYACDVVLTEESFHDYYNENGGYWATVMAAPVRFSITR